LNPSCFRNEKSGNGQTIYKGIIRKIQKTRNKIVEEFDCFREKKGVQFGNILMILGHSNTPLVNKMRCREICRREREAWNVSEWCTAILAGKNAVNAQKHCRVSSCNKTETIVNC
jgi:hypothetical protein